MVPLLVRARGDLNDAQLVRIVGGKALNLLRLSEMLEAAGGDAREEAARPDVIVPAFFAVTTHAFALFMRENDLAPRIRVPEGCADLGAHAASVREAVPAATITFQKSRTISCAFR